MNDIMLKMRKRSIRKISHKSAKSLFTTTGLFLCLYALSVLYLPPLVYGYLISIESPILLGISADYYALGIFYLIYVIFTIGIFYILSIVSGIHIKEICRPCAFSFKRYITESLLLTAITLFAWTFSGLLLNRFMISSPFLAPIGMLQAEKYFTEPLYLFIFIIVAPFVEEFAYRGILLRLLGRFGNDFAVFAIAFIYAVAHTNLAEMFPSFIMSYLLAKLTLSKKSILPAVAVHMTFNSILIPMVLIPEGYGCWVAIIIVAIIASAAAIIFFRLNPDVVIKKQKQSKEVMAMFFKTPSVIIAILMMIIHSILSYYL